MTDLNKHKKEIIKVLKTLKKDAQMAIDGEWDVRGDGFPLNGDAEDAFESQITLIDQLLSKIQ